MQKLEQIMGSKKLTGGCLCGSVRYVISENPQCGYICHCGFCQKQTGMASRPAITVNKASIHFYGDSMGEYKHVIPDHGRAIYPIFCNKCGTNLDTILERFPDVQVINIGTLDNPNDAQVTIEYFSDEALFWVTHNVAHTVYHQHRFNEDGTDPKPKRMGNTSG